jgi:hypothetical protein
VAGVIVDHEVAEGGVILRSGVTVAGGYAVGVIMLRGGYAMVGAFAVGDVSFAEGSNLAGHGMTMGSEVAEGGVAIVADDAIVGGGMIVAVDYDVAQELARCAGGPTVSHVPQTLNASVRFLASAPTCTGVSERTPRARRPPWPPRCQPPRHHGDRHGRAGPRPAAVKPYAAGSNAPIAMPQDGARTPIRRGARGAARPPPMPVVLA